MLTLDEFRFKVKMRKLKQVLRQTGQMERFNLDGNQFVSSDEIFTALDTDGDGLLSYEEFMAALHIAPQVGRAARPGPLTTASRNLLEICQTGGLERAKQLLAEGVAFADVRDESGCTTLFHACVHGHLDIAMLLLDHGCNIDALNDTMCSALSATYFSTRAAGGFIDSDLLGEAYSQYLTTETGTSGDVLDKVMAELLRRGANPNCPPGPGSALASAVRGKDLRMVKELLRRGADPNDGLGSAGANSVLLIALQMLKENSKRLSTSVAFVADAHANLLKDNSEEEIENQSPELGVVMALLGAGADVNTPNADGLFPLHVASTVANKFGLHALKKVLGKAQGRDMICAGRTALSSAVNNGNVAGAQILLEEGADANCLVEDDRSVLQLLLQKSRESLFKAGARLDLAKAMLGVGANPLQKVNIAAVDTEAVMGLVMDQAYVEYEPREKSRKEQATATLHAGAEGEPKFSAVEEWPIMDLLIEQMRETNKQHIMKTGKPMEKFCEECGRSHGVPFHSCNRCGMVVFCRDKCKMRAFSTHHRAICVTYRKLRGMDTWGNDGEATQWKPRKLPDGKEFQMENWQRNAARPFKVPEGFEPPDEGLAYQSAVRSTPIRTTTRNGKSRSNHTHNGHGHAVGLDGVEVEGGKLASALLDDVIGGAVVKGTTSAGRGDASGKMKVRHVPHLTMPRRIYSRFPPPPPL